MATSLIIGAYAEEWSKPLASHCIYLYVGVRFIQAEFGYVIMPFCLFHAFFWELQKLGSGGFT